MLHYFWPQGVERKIARSRIVTFVFAQLFKNRPKLAKNVIFVAMKMKSGLNVLISVLIKYGKFKVFLLPANNFVAAYVPDGELRLITKVLGPGKEY